MYEKFYVKMFENVIFYTNLRKLFKSSFFFNNIKRLFVAVTIQLLRVMFISIRIYTFLLLLIWYFHSVLICHVLFIFLCCSLTQVVEQTNLIWNIYFSLDSKNFFGEFNFKSGNAWSSYSSVKELVKKFHFAQKKVEEVVPHQKLYFAILS